MTSLTGAPRAVRTDPSAPLILHVTEAMGGGLEDAVHDFVRSAPRYRHALLFTRRGAFATADGHPDNLVEIVDAGRGFRALDRAYGNVVARLQPDVIHLHSAWAGLIGRVRSRGPRPAAVVYSPHSYFFDRRDVLPPLRGLARAVERGLASRTALTAAVSPAEASVARSLGSPSAYIPNIARTPPQLLWVGTAGAAPHVVMAGRITGQKDPRFFLEVLEHVRPQAPEARWTWVGSGDPRMERRLRAAGVEVTGWVPRSRSLDSMAGASVYLHTAAWEGSPITLLEAAMIGVPIVARSIDALDSLGFDSTLRTPQQVGDALLRVLAGVPVESGPPAPEPAEQVEAIQLAYSQVAPLPVAAPLVQDAELAIALR